MINPAKVWGQLIAHEGMMAGDAGTRNTNQFVSLFYLSLHGFSSRPSIFYEVFVKRGA
jgi:hypothetical protein